MNNLRFVAPVERWAVWRSDEGAASGATTARAPDVSFVDAILRRRLSTLMKMSLKVAHDCLQGLPRVRLVYASRHGELNRTTSILEELAQDEPISPTAFSMAVLNASVGILSILRNDTAPATAISAAGASFGYGLLEATMQFELNPTEPVMLIYADEPVPKIYGDGDSDPPYAHAVAVLLIEHASCHIECTIESTMGLAGEESQSQSFLRCIDGDDKTSWQGENKTWTWSRHAN